jgi:hypothetical protein
VGYQEDYKTKPLPEPLAKVGGNTSASLPLIQRLTRAPQNIDYEYPIGFPITSEDVVEAEHILAMRECNEGLQKAGSYREREDLQRKRIMRAFDKFASEACKLKTPGPWSTRRIRGEVIEYLRTHLAMVGLSWEDSVVQEGVTKSSQWREFENALAPNANDRAARNGDESLEPTTEGNPARKRGPKVDHEGAARVAEIVACVAPDGEWRSKLDAVCEALDEAEVSCPKPWRRKFRTCDGWADYPDRATAVKAIEGRLRIARQQKEATPKTLS